MRKILKRFMELDGVLLRLLVFNCGRQHFYVEEPGKRNIQKGAKFFNLKRVLIKIVESF